jgi:hypothetical protein
VRKRNKSQFSRVWPWLSFAWLPIVPKPFTSRPRSPTLWRRQPSSAKRFAELLRSLDGQAHQILHLIIRPLAYFKSLRLFLPVAWLICGAGWRSAHSLFVYLQLQQSAPEIHIKEGRIALRHPGKVADYAVPAVPIASDAMGGLEQRPFVLGRYHVPGALLSAAPFFVTRLETPGTLQRVARTVWRTSAKGLVIRGHRLRRGQLA